MNKQSLSIIKPVYKDNVAKVMIVPGLVVSVVVSILAIFRGGHIGPDYWNHLPKIFEPARVFDFSWAHPPLNYALGHALAWIVGDNALPITLSILQVLINAASLWWFFSFTYSRFRSKTLHAAFALFITFLPVRVLHSASIGTDWMTIPVFVLVLYVLDRFLAYRDGNLIAAALLGGALAIGFWSKYSLIAFFPALLVIMIFVGQSYRWSVGRFVVICAITFVPPSMLVLYTTRASAAADSLMTKIWIPAEGIHGHPEMDYWDMFSVKAADLHLFTAPQYFRPEDSYWFRLAHLHSYLGMSHMATFTDTMNLFQNLPADKNVHTVHRPDDKWRDAWKTPIMQASMILGLLWTILALAGTPWLLIRAVKGLWDGRLEREYLMAFLGIFYFLVLFLPIPFVFQGSVQGYWAPRYMLVPFLFFFLAGFLLVDAKIGKSIVQVPPIVLTLVLLQCVIVVTMLI